MRKNIIEKLTDKETKRSLEWHLKCLPDPYIPPLFAIGFTLGQMFDLPHPDHLKDLEALKGVMEKRRCFGYLPRKRKSGSSRSMKRTA